MNLVKNITYLTKEIALVSAKIFGAGIGISVLIMVCTIGTVM